MGLCAFYALQLLMNSRKSHCLSTRLNYQASVGIYLKVCSSYFLCLIYYILAVETLQSTILRFLTLWTLLYSVIILFECFVWKVCYDYFIWIVLNGLSENFPLNSMIVFFFECLLYSKLVMYWWFMFLCNEWLLYKNCCKWSFLKYGFWLHHCWTFDRSSKIMLNIQDSQ